MAITIRNKETERIIRDVGRQTGEGPSALIARLVEQEERRLVDGRRAQHAERRRALRQLIEETPPVSEDARRAVWEELGAMYDEDGLPR